MVLQGLRPIQVRPKNQVGIINQAYLIRLRIIAKVFLASNKKMDFTLNFEIVLINVFAAPKIQIAARVMSLAATTY